MRRYQPEDWRANSRYRCMEWTQQRMHRYLGRHICLHRRHWWLDFVHFLIFSKSYPVRQWRIDANTSSARNSKEL